MIGNRSIDRWGRNVTQHAALHPAALIFAALLILFSILPVTGAEMGPPSRQRVSQPTTTRSTAPRI